MVLVRLGCVVSVPKVLTSPIDSLQCVDVPNFGLAKLGCIRTAGPTLVSWDTVQLPSLVDTVVVVLSLEETVGVVV